MEALILAPSVCIIGVLVILLTIALVNKFCCRDMVKERALEQLILNHRQLQSEATDAKKVADDLQRKADAMKSIVQSSMDNLPNKSRKAFACNPVLLSKH